MNADGHAHAKRLFLAACELKETDRAAYLDEACGGDAELRAEVESLLRFHDPKTLLEAPTADLDAHAAPSGGRGDASGEQTGAPHPASPCASPRFTPGEMIAGRYRIVSRLGRGGMGEVYRADDLRLHRPVALKFIDPGRTQDAAWLGRFSNEARVALEVTHANICRIYDLGYASGEAFISMEYVDGEDLASLLRRIGRMPRDKAMDIARQLCFALAAAHGRNVLHRDLKPANIMIDGQGRVRVTDFGLSVLSDGGKGPCMLAGTPAYMAPEALLGQPVTVQTDLYALGLILYEMFTGRKVFGDEFPSDPSARSAPERPTEINPEVEPQVEALILRCLSVNPADRPASALEVAAALTGGDLLAAVVAAGQTPSPETIAAAGTGRHMPPGAAVGLAVAGVVALILSVAMAPVTLLLSGDRLPKSPHVLEEQSRRIANTFSRTQPDAGRWSFVAPRPAVRRSGAAGTAPADAPAPTAERPLPVAFEYRSDRQVSAPDQGRPVSAVLVRLDPHGRLVQYADRTPHPISPMTRPAEPDWQAATGFARVRPESISPAQIATAPPVFADHVRAWHGELDDDPALPVRIDAGSIADRVVFYRVSSGPPPVPVAGESSEPALHGADPGQTITDTLYLSILAGGAVLAWRSLAGGRGDRRGAFRLAALMFLADLAFQFLRGGLLAGFSRSSGDVLQTLRIATFTALASWILYLGMEGYVRRFWPQSIVSWSRLLRGTWADPLIGTDVLIGATAGLTLLLLQQLHVWISVRSGQTQVPLLMSGGSSDLGMLLGLGHTLSAYAQAVSTAVGRGMLALMLMLLIRLVVKHRWATLAVFFAIVTVSLALTGQAAGLSPWLVHAIVVGGIALLLTHRGLLATIVCIMVARLMLSHPITSDVQSWCASSTAAATLPILAMIFYGLYAQAGRRGSPGTLHPIS